MRLLGCTDRVCTDRLWLLHANQEVKFIIKTVISFPLGGECIVYLVVQDLPVNDIHTMQAVEKIHRRLNDPTLPVRSNQP